MSAPPMPLISDGEVLRALSVYCPWDRFEIRVLTPNGVFSGVFDDAALVAPELARIAASRPTGVYCMPNPLVDSVEVTNHLLRGASIGDAQIARRAWLLLDVDPVRPSKTNATDQEKSAAHRVHTAIYELLTVAHGWPDYILADSGNGHHGLIPTDLPVDSPLVRRLLNALAAKFDTPEAHVDKSVHNPARIWKLPGTRACKASATVDRPQRMARLVQVPAVLQAVTAAQIEEVIEALGGGPLQLEARPKPSPTRPADDAWTAAKEAYKRDKTPSDWPDARPGTCPTCHHNECFKLVRGSSDRWICLSDDHAARSGGCGQPNKSGFGWGGDIIDIHKTQTGKTDVELLREAGYWPDRMADDPVVREIALELQAVQKERAPAKTEKPKKVATSDNEQEGLERGSEVELSEKAAEAFVGPGGVGLVYDEGSFHQWNGQIWDRVHRVAIANRIASWDGALVTPDEDSPGKPRTLMLSQKAIKGSVERLSELQMQERYFGTAPDGVAFRNGFVRVNEFGEVLLEPHQPGQRQRSIIDQDYVPGAVPELYLKHLEACWDGCDDILERARFFGEFIGAALIGIATKFELALVLLGSGSNGKSTALRPIRALFPANAVGSVAIHDWGKEYYRARLVGRRLNIVTEMPDTEIMNSEAVKAIISGEPIEARRPYEPPFEFEAKAAHILAANELPPVRDTSAGQWRRLSILTFPNVFSGDSREIDHSSKLMGELGALAAWAIEAAARLIRRGAYALPKSSDEEVSKWRRETDSVATWLDERCDETSTPFTTAATLYEDYQSWCPKRGSKPVSMTKWGRRMAALGNEKHKGHVGARYHLVLKAAQP